MSSLVINSHFEQFTSFMPPVNAFAHQLDKLQSVWDNLSLLGQLSGVGHEMGNTRESFFNLSQSLLQLLSQEHGSRIEQNMMGKSAVLVEMMLRNLFERTADIGFLATDDSIRLFLKKLPQWHQRAGQQFREMREVEESMMRQRLAAYVDKYSVYHDVILLSPKGDVLCRLNPCDVTVSNDPLIAEAITTKDPYVEVFRETDLLPNVSQPLIYAYRVTDDAGAVLGVICLCFNFPDECHRIFKETYDGDWSVMLLTDANGKVIASSDTLQVPLFTQLPSDKPEQLNLHRFAGRRYLSITRPGKGYQGYLGQGWMGRIMLPLEQAFTSLPEIDFKLPSIEGLSIFSEALMAIPEEAEEIQVRLNRSVWNGSVHQGKSNQDQTFTRALLSEVSQTGVKTQTVFTQAINNLYETIIGAMIENNRFLASLAVNIMDRNLYERANDCRWWAMNDLFRQKLAQEEISLSESYQLTQVLSYINDLYTVYTGIVLYDHQGVVKAVSKTDLSEFIGKPLKTKWANDSLKLTDSQSYVVSDFETTPLYQNRPTYIYAAAVMHPENDQQAVGGIGIIFDSQPQFEAMLADASPNVSSKRENEVFAVFYDDQQRVIASTHNSITVGHKLPINFDHALENGGAIVDCAIGRYAVGLGQSTGYREYKSEHDNYQQAIYVAMFKRIGKLVDPDDNQPSKIKSLEWNIPISNKQPTQEIATFCIGDHLCALPVDSIIEAIDLPDLSSQIHGKSIFVGYTPYQNRALPVLDIAAYLGVEINAKQVIVLSIQDMYLGILVGELGSVVHLPEHLIIPVQAQINAIIHAIIEREDKLPLYMLSTTNLHRLAQNGLTEATQMRSLSELDLNSIETE